MEGLKQMLKVLDEAIHYCEELDHAYTRYYRSLIRKRRAVARTIKVFEREDRRLRKHGDV